MLNIHRLTQIKSSLSRLPKQMVSQRLCVATNGDRTLANGYESNKTNKPSASCLTVWKCIDFYEKDVSRSKYVDFVANELNSSSALLELIDTKIGNQIIRYALLE